MAAEHDRQPAVGLGSRNGCDAVNDFLLQHEVHVDNRVPMVEQMEEQRRGDVVGEVADEPQLRTERREVERQRVGFVDMHVAGIREVHPQRGRQVPVQLHCMQLPAT